MHRREVGVGSGAKHIRRSLGSSRATGSEAFLRELPQGVGLELLVGDDALEARSRAAAL